MFFSTSKRKQYKLWSEGKQTMINEERVAALEKLGFSWSLRVSVVHMLVIALPETTTTQRLL